MSSAFGNHVCGGLSVARGDIRHDGGISNTEVGDTDDSETVVNDSIRIAGVAHLAGSNEVIARTSVGRNEPSGVTQNVGGESKLVLHVVGIIEGEGENGSRRKNLEGLVHDVNHGFKVLGILEVVGGDKWLIAGVLGEETNMSSASGSV